MTSTMMTAAPTQPTQPARKLGRGALRTYRHLLNQGGWWSVRELCDALEVTRNVSLLPQLYELLDRQHIMRRGAGVAGDPYTYGVTAACVPVPGVELEVA